MQDRHAAVFRVSMSCVGTMDETDRRSASEAAESKYLTFARYVLVATLVVAGVGLLLYFVWFAAQLLLLIFAGVLVSILLRGIARLIRQWTGIGKSLSIALVALASVAVIVFTVWLLAGRMGAQIAEIERVLPHAVESVKEYLRQFEFARQAVDNMPSLPDWLASRGGALLSQVTAFASTAIGALLNALVAFVIGLYLAFQPSLYSGGVKQLLPVRFRDRAGEVFSELDRALWSWLGGRFVLMMVNGVLTGLGLWLIGVPLALTLGVLAGLLNFIPTFGPWIAAVPAVLIAFMQSPQHALYTALLYLALQSLDGYVFTPLVDRKSVEMPPVLTISAMLLLGVAFGFLGLLLASPLAATVMILVKMLYIEDVIGQPAMGKAEDENGGSGGHE